MSDKQKQARLLAILSTLALVVWVLNAAIGGVDVINAILIAAFSVTTGLSWAEFTHAGRRAR